MVAVNQQKGMLNYPIINTAVLQPERVQRVRVANDMTVYETSIWIWTLGYNHGWLEAEWYSKRFQENNIAGNILPSLSLQMLEQNLGIQNPTHRMTIKSTIDYLFPANKQEQFKAPIEIGFGEKRPGSTVSNEELESLNSEMCTPSGSVDGMSESGFSTNASSLGDSLMNSTIHVGDRRSSAKNLVRLKVLKRLKIRAGVSLKDRKIGVLEKSEIVTVNLVDGRRARVISENKAPAISGWVSLHSETGSPYLEPLE
jgi:hypothetical protein